MSTHRSRCNPAILKGEITRRAKGVLIGNVDIDPTLSEGDTLSKKQGFKIGDDENSCVER